MTIVRRKRSAHLAFWVLLLFLAALLFDCSPITIVTADPSETSSVWTTAQRQRIQSLSLSGLVKPKDASNRYVNDSKAIELGSKLFFDRRLSRTGQVACASCHQPDNYFTDGRVRALGQGIGKRNTPSLHGVSHNTWFFWDGRKDSLWSQALAPLENPVEHNFTRTALVKQLLTDKGYRMSYAGIFGTLDDTVFQGLPDHAQPDGTLQQIKAWKAMPIWQRQAVDQVFANIGKVLAAYVATLKPLRSRFDDYADALNNQQADPAGLLNKQELKGLRLFISQQAQCIHCHTGPLLTNQSFHNIGSGRRGVDSGRAAAVDVLRFDRFNCMGDFSDQASEQCSELRFMQRDRHQLWGAYKTPTLRNIANTAPYFHDGRYQTLAAAIEHYANTPADESIISHLPVIKLSNEDKSALLAFLKTLSARETGD